MRFIKHCLIYFILTSFVFNTNLCKKYNFHSALKIEEVQAFDVPEDEDFLLYIVAFALSVITPTLLAKMINKFSQDLENASIQNFAASRSALYQRTKNLFLNTMGTTAFFFGIGWPVVGSDVFTASNLLGFVVTNMLMHAMLKHPNIETFMKKLLPEWTQVSGVSLKLNGDILNFNFVIDKSRRTFRVFPSPANVLDPKTFIDSIERLEEDGHITFRITLKEKFRPVNSKGVFDIRASQKALSDPNASAGEIISFAFGDLHSYAQDPYFDRKLNQHFLWRTQWWTKLFNFYGGVGQQDNPFKTIQHVLTVAVAAPLAFGMGGVFSELFAGSLNFTGLHPSYFPYALIEAMTLGGMLSAATASAAYEKLAHITYDIRAPRKLPMVSSNPCHEFFEKEGIVPMPAAPVAMQHPAFNYMPKISTNNFGKAMEFINPFYKYGRYIVAMLAGGLGVWYFSGFGAEEEPLLEDNEEDRKKGGEHIFTVPKKKKDKKLAMLGKKFVDRVSSQVSSAVASLGSFKSKEALGKLHSRVKGELQKNFPNSPSANQQLLGPVIKLGYFSNNVSLGSYNKVQQAKNKQELIETFNEYLSFINVKADLSYLERSSVSLAQARDLLSKYIIETHELATFYTLEGSFVPSLKKLAGQEVER